jgi:NADPH2:quinone reductase
MTLAAVCTELTGEGSIQIQTLEPVALGPGAVRIDVRAASVNYPDVLMIRGLYQSRLEPPFVPGTECAGVITEVGADVVGLSVGNRVLTVCGSGAFATDTVATPPVYQVHRIPDTMPFADAAAFNITYGTGIHGLLRRGGLHEGESVVVLGASGGCGSAAIQIAKAAGAQVIAVAGGDEKCQLAHQLGADAVLDHHTLTSLSEAVKRHTGGRGADVVFDTVGGPDIREPLRSLAWNGRYLVIGFASGDIPTIKVNQTILKGISVVGVAYGMSAIIDPQANAEDFAQLFEWYGQGKVTPSIGHRFALADTADALRVLFERRALGKVIIEMPA